MKIGNAKYGSGGFAKRNYFKLKDGESVFRILPPIGDLAEQGRWSMFYNVHYGYKNSAGKMRAFQSPLVKNRKTKMIESPDAALERIEQLKAELEKAKSSGNKARAEQIMVLAGGQKSLYNLDSHHYMNVVDLSGNIGILKIRHRCKLALDAEISKLRDEGTDPLSADNGRFFVFRRTGSGLDTSFQVTVYSEKKNIPGVGQVLQPVVHVLDDALIARLEKEAAQLDKLFKRPTSEEVARIVTSSDLKTGTSPACDEIFDKGNVQSATAADESEDEPGADYQEPKAAPMATKAAASTNTFTNPTSESAKSKSVAPAAKTVAPAAPAPAEQNDEDFLKSLGI